jgi:hypothetical protein
LEPAQVVGKAQVSDLVTATELDLAMVMETAMELDLV